MDLLFTAPRSFTNAIVSLITLILLHGGFLTLEIIFIFWYGSSDDDRFQYGIITKIATLLGVHMTSSMLIVLAADYGTSDWKTGIISGWAMSTFYKITFVVKEVVLYGVIIFVNYLNDVDYDKGFFKPWGKALIWSGIHTFSLLMFYFIWYGIKISGRINRIVCETLDGEDTEVYYGDAACIPKCELYWQADPSICLQYETINEKTNFSMTQVFLVPNMVISYLILMIFFMIGLIWIPYRAWYKIKEAQKPPINNETDLKVAQAEILEMARAMKRLGLALGHRRIAFSKKKFKFDMSHFKAQFRLHLDYNRYIHGCYLLFEQYEYTLYREKQGLDKSRLTHKGNQQLAWARFIVGTINSLCFLVYILIFRIGCSARNDVVLSTKKSPVSLLLAVALDANFFPLPTILALSLHVGVMLIAIAGYRGFLKVSAIDRPLRGMKKGKMKIRDILSMTTMSLHLCSGIILFHAIHLDYYNSGTWLNRNFYSVIMFYEHGLIGKAIVEILALVMMILWLAATFYRHPKKMPWGLTADSDPLAKADELCIKWEKGESTSRIGETFHRGAEAINKGAEDAKQKARSAAFEQTKPKLP